MFDIGDHPDIARIERTGYGEDEINPTCPVCGRECNEVYIHDGEVVGCDLCVDILDVWDAYDMYLRKED